MFRYSFGEVLVWVFTIFTTLIFFGSIVSLIFWGNISIFIGSIGAGIIFGIITIGIRRLFSK